MALVCLLLFASLGSLGFGPPVLTDGGYPPLRLYPEQVQAIEALAQPPAISAAAALLTDVDTGQVLYALHEHQPLAPASTTKIMTALLTLQRGTLSDSVTVSANAAATGGSTMGLQAGETLTVRDLLTGLLIPSGNDAAVALAEYVSGDEARFVGLMNQTAAQMGLNETRFVNPHGLDDPGQKSSAADLMVMTRTALSYPAFAEIVASQSADVAGHQLATTNQLLGTYPGADGVKTGTTDEAGECLIASVSRRGHRLLLVLLHSADRYADAQVLLDYAAAGWSWRPVSLPENALSGELGPDGKIYRLRTVTSTDVFLPAWQWPLVRPVVTLNAGVPLTGTVPIGSLRLTLGSQTLASVPIDAWPGP